MKKNVLILFTITCCFSAFGMQYFPFSNMFSNFAPQKEITKIVDKLSSDAHTENVIDFTYKNSKNFMSFFNILYAYSKKTSHATSSLLSHLLTTEEYNFLHASNRLKGRRKNILLEKPIFGIAALGRIDLLKILYKLDKENIKTLDNIGMNLLDYTMFFSEKETFQYFSNPKNIDREIVDYF